MTVPHTPESYPFSAHPDEVGPADAPAPRYPNPRFTGLPGEQTFRLTYLDLRNKSSIDVGDFFLLPFSHFLAIFETVQ
jgi:hypothetical protein